MTRSSMRAGTRWMGSPRHATNRWRRTREGPEPACVRAPFKFGVEHTGGEGRINVLPWYRQVGVASTSTETQGKMIGLPARVSGRHVVQGRLSSPVLECTQVTRKAGENGQNSAAQGGSPPWTRPSAPECGGTLKAPAGDQRPI